MRPYGTSLLKRLLLPLLLGAALSARAADSGGRVVGEVAAEGNRFMKKKAVLSKAKVRKNDVVVDPAFRADVDRLLESGLFDDVQVALEDIPGAVDAHGRPRVKVTFRVKERPLIRRVDFKGQSKLSKSKFQDELSSKAGDPYDRYKAAQDAQRILGKYRDEGYADAEVEYYTSLAPKTNKVILTFFITEGSRVLVDEVKVEGNRAFSVKKVRKVLKKTRRKKVFKEDLLKEDLEALEKFYKNHGYFQVRVSPPGRVFNEDHTRVTLTLNVEEGRRYRVEGISFSGETLFSKKQLADAVTFKAGKLYNEDRMEETQQNLQDLYADKGYLRAEIDPRPTTRDVDDRFGRVDILFEIAESSVVYVDRIYIDGNTYTKEKVIRREVLLKEGDVFSAGKVRKSVEKIYNLGFLDDVQVDLQQPRSPSMADIVFSVQEGKPGVLSAGAGYSSVDQLVGTMQIQHMNFLGRAQRVNLMWEFGKRKQNIELGWTDPWFLDKRMSFGVDLYNTDRRLPLFAPPYETHPSSSTIDYTGRVDDSSAYTLSRKGFALRLGPRITDRFSLIHSYSYEKDREHNIEPFFSQHPDPLFRKQENRRVKSSMLHGLVYDTRDNYFDATRGWRNSLTAEVAGGPLAGTLDFYKPEAAAAVYIPTFWKFVFSVSARASFIEEFGDTELVPESERFLLGGPDTVRGYEFGWVGERYGRSMLLFNAEYKFPIVQEKKRTILQGAFFADAGGAWDRGGSSNPLRHMNWEIGHKPHQLRSSFGFGIRFKTPVFPIRLDWAVPLSRKRVNENYERFSFTIGNIF